MWWPLSSKSNLTHGGEQETAMLWLEVEAANTRFVDVTKLDTLTVSYVHGGNYKVTGTIKDRDVCIRSGFGTSREADEFVRDLVKQLMT